MTFRRQFVTTLVAILGMGDSAIGHDGLHERIDTLESLFMEKAAELEQVKEMMTVLIMTNPNVRIVNPDDGHAELMVSGSSDEGPDGRLLN